MAKKIINVVYDVNDKDLDTAKKKIQDVEKETKKSEDGFQKLGNTGVKAFGIIAGAATALGLAAIGKRIFDITAQFQKLSAVLTNTLGSRSQANQALRDIQKFASQTPFSVVELTDSFVKLANQGFKPTSAELRKLGDLASSQGKSFNQLTEAIIDAQTGEFERLKEFGIRAAKEGNNVAFTFKGVQTQTDFTAESIRKYILSLGELQGVSGGMAAISATLEGKLSNLGDNFDSLLNSIGSSSSGVIGGFLDFANNVLGAVNEALNDNVKALQDEQFELNALVGAATSVNATQEVRAALIDEINRKYPDFLKNLDAEKVTNEELTKRMANVNDQFLRKIALQATEDKFLDTQGEIVDLVAEEVRVRKQIEALKAGKEPDANIKDLIFYDRSATAQERIKLLEEDIIEIQEERSELQNQMVKDLELYNEALKIFDLTSNDYFTTVTKTVPTVKALNKELSEFKTLTVSGKTDPLNVSGQINNLDKLNAGLDKHVARFQDAEKKKTGIVSEESDNQIALRQRVAQLSEELIISSLEYALTQREVDTQSISEKYERELELAGDNDRAKEQIEMERDRKLRAADIKNKQIQKDNARTKILIDTAVAVIKTFSEFGYPAGIIPAGLMTGISLIQLANLKKYKDGKVDIDGPGTTTSDSIYAKISRGESVINAAATSKSKNLLEAINDRKIDDRILQVASNGGSQVNVFDDSRIIEELRKGKVDYEVHGYTLMRSERSGSNFKRIIRAKNQGY